MCSQFLMRAVGGCYFATHPFGGSCHCLNTWIGTMWALLRPFVYIRKDQQRPVFLYQTKHFVMFLKAHMACKRGDLLEGTSTWSVCLLTQSLLDHRSALTHAVVESIEAKCTHCKMAASDGDGSILTLTKKLGL